MDEFNSLISLQEVDIDNDSSSYSFHHHHIIPSLPLHQQTSIEQDLLIIPTPAPNLLTPVLGINELNNNSSNNNNNVQKKGIRKQRKLSSVQDEDGNNGSDPPGNKQKRIVHRDIERQRRQEMASLYSSLRTLLPLEYIRGKRSICDQVNEAVNYIKYQEKNIKQLQSKRDKLRNSLETNPSDQLADMSTKEGTSTKYSSSPVEISIKPCSHGGVEILISNEVVGEEPCPLSSVLQVLVEVGLTVVSCFCTKVKDKFLYTIQTEATVISTEFYIRVVPQKLSEKINAPINIKCSSSSNS